jgi:putative SOS response-associated peptidase YedK
MKDDSPFVFAGLWEGRKDLANGEWLRTRAIITGEPNEFVREIRTRMPIIIPEEHHESWLSGEAGKEVLVPYPADRMKAWPELSPPRSTLKWHPSVSRLRRSEQHRLSLQSQGIELIQRQIAAGNALLQGSFEMAT